MAEADRKEADGPQGIGGWLALFVVGLLILVPATIAFRTTMQFYSTELAQPKLASHPLYLSFKAAYSYVVVLCIAASVCLGLRLSVDRTRSSVHLARAFLVGAPLMSLGLNLGLATLIFPKRSITDELVGEAIDVATIVAAVSVFWLVFLHWSARVANTYPPSRKSERGLSSRPADNIPGWIATFRRLLVDFAHSSTVARQLSPAEEQEVREIVALEFADGRINSLRMLQHMINAGGDEARARALYLEEQTRQVLERRLRQESSLRLRTDVRVS